MKILKNIKNGQRGMTYVELIVVLSIFSVVSSVAIYNYGDFQDRVDIKNVASDVALKVVEAQRSSLSGLLPSVTVSSTWKPSYGVYFKTNPVAEKSRFLYFVDADADKFFDGTACTGECLSNILVTKGNLIDELRVYYTNGSDAVVTDLSVSFTRPDSRAIMTTGAAGSPPLANFTHIRIKILSPKGAASYILVFESGRIEMQ